MAIQVCLEGLGKSPVCTDIGDVSFKDEDPEKITPEEARLACSALYRLAKDEKIDTVKPDRFDDIAVVIGKAKATLNKLADLTVIDFPKQFSISENAVSVGGKVLGLIGSEGIVNPKLTDPKGHTVALGGEFLTVPIPVKMDTLKVKDPLGRLIGRVSEFSAVIIGTDQITISDKHQNGFTASRMSWVGGALEFKRNGQVHAVMKKEGDVWTVQRLTDEIDPRLLVFVPWII